MIPTKPSRPSSCILTASNSSSRRQLGISTVVVHHGRGTSRRTRLAAPTSGPLGYDGEFQDKVRIMRSYWAAHRERAGETTAA